MGLTLSPDQIEGSEWIQNKSSNLGRYPLHVMPISGVVDYSPKLSINKPARKRVSVQIAFFFVPVWLELIPCIVSNQYGVAIQIHAKKYI